MAEKLREAVGNITAPDKWGFRIYRCDYTSQETWDKFLSLIKEDAREVLEEYGTAECFNTLGWNVIENKEALNGKSWKEVKASIHDPWVLAELEKERKEGRDREWGDHLSEAVILQNRVEMHPEYEFFIFADETSVNSVVDCDKNATRSAPGGYYITIVQSDLVSKQGGWLDDWDSQDEEFEGVPRPEPDKTDPEQKKALVNNFKAWRLAEAYVALVNGCWHEGFEGVESGITELR
ncbi:hypothetical protein PVAG01_08997 [Phlyctema vagabunda]|uniref:Uncharacterized protein n=1 Tax=Phlyctema vagabunda TaxID=108571 RepID=A0ABR4P646_9HELO